MLRRFAMLLVLSAVILPAGAFATEWEEDYSDGWTDESPPPQDEYPVSVDMDASASVTFDSFHGSLAPYGDWVVVGSYGRVWRPHVAGGWRPYFYGRWEWTSEGWLWVSDEPWGWAAYHYGRWAHDPYYGWVWVPGYQWAPAWVSWRYSGDVVGWAPLAPGVSVFVSVTPFVDTWWTFVPCDRFVAVPVREVAFAPSHAHDYFRRTIPAPARPGSRPMPGRAIAAPVWGGPPPRAIEQRVGRPITPMRVVTAPSPGAGRVGPGEVAIYRPEVRGGARAAPGSAARPQARDPRGMGAGPRGLPEADRAGVRPAPGERGFEHDRGSTPAPAIRGDAGRVAPRAMPGPAAPDGAGTRAERAWTPEPRAPRGGPFVGGPAAPRSEFRGGGVPGPRMGGGVAAPQPRMRAGGEGGARPAPGPRVRER